MKSYIVLMPGRIDGVQLLANSCESAAEQLVLECLSEGTIRGEAGTIDVRVRQVDHDIDSSSIVEVRWSIKGIERRQMTNGTFETILFIRHILQQNLESRRMDRDSLSGLHLKLLNHIQAHSLEWSKVEGWHISRAAQEADYLILETEQALCITLKGRLYRRRLNHIAGRIYRFCRVNNLLPK